MVTVRKKRGVSSLADAHPKIQAAVDAAAQVTPLDELWINSLNDSHHREGSFHFSNRAVDFQTKLMESGAEVAFARALAEKLGCTEERRKGRDWWEPGGNGYRALLESLDVDGKEHLHVEWRG